MPANHEPSDARVSMRASGSVLDVALEGAWNLDAARPEWAQLAAEAKAAQVVLRADAVSRWDASLLLFIDDIRQWCLRTGASFDVAGLPDTMRDLAGQFGASAAAIAPKDRLPDLPTVIGLRTMRLYREMVEILRFVGECAMGAGRFVLKPAAFRWRDCAAQMQICGAMALPIVSLIAFLVGVTVAYSGAVVLRKFGADIYIADLVGVAMAREMGALMTAVVLAGRTGAAFAAELGSMKANEEIDALSTLGIPAVRFLVLPRLLALALMTPLLAIYSVCLGIAGGLVIAWGLLHIPPTAYWVEMQTIVDVPDLSVGLIKSVVFGLIVGLSGCLRGLQADRNASGVGRAATSAVVTTILWLVVADAVFAVIFETVGL